MRDGYKNASPFKIYDQSFRVKGSQDLKKELFKLFRAPAELDLVSYRPPIKRHLKQIINSLMENSTIHKGWISVPFSKLGESWKKAFYRLEKEGYIELRLGSERSKKVSRIKFLETWYIKLDSRPTVPLKFQNRKFNKVLKEGEGNKVEIELPPDHARVKIINDLVKNLEGNLYETSHRKIETANISMRIDETNQELGRVYCYQFQSIPKEERKTLTINGNPTVDIDYRSMHPGLLYKSLGLKMPVDAYAIEKGIRALTKMVLLVALNCKGGKKGVIKAVIWSDDFHELAFQETVYELKGEFVSDFKAHLKKRKGELRELISETFDKLAILHAPIAQYFGTGVARQCFYHESHVLLSAIKTLMMKYPGLPLIPIHDALIVEESMAATVHSEMMSALYSYTPILKSDALIAPPFLFEKAA